MATKNEATVETTSNNAEVDVNALMTELKTKSAVIRKLHADGKTRSQIASLLGIRYQHVRNVLTQPLKKAE